MTLPLAVSRLLPTIPWKLRRMPLFALVACLVLGGSSLNLFADDHGPGYVDQLEIVSTYPAYGGASFGTVGPYTVIVAIAHNKLDPDNPANAGIVDVKLAPRDAHGMVDYSEDVLTSSPHVPSQRHTRPLL